ncbi:MAG: hypothetical protein IPJ19_21555 [Planctomycetes bacterium]|nr:hypothetical protein [Planctomycetota bacterium]
MHRSVMPPKGRARNGSALVPALLAVMLTAALCVSYLQLSISKNRESQVSIDSKRAFYLAESGLSEAFYGLARGMSGTVGNESNPVRFGTGIYWVTCDDLGDRVTLHSTGLSGMGRAALSTTLRKGHLSVASLGAFGDQELSLRSGALIDAYDSRAPQQQGLPGLLPGLLGGSPPKANSGSNSNVTLAGAAGATPPARIDGDSNPGPGGAVIRGTGATVTGSTAPIAEPASLAELEVTVPVGAPDYILPAGVRTYSLSGSHAYGQMHVPAGATLHISGPAELVAEQFILDAGARVELDGSSGAVNLSVAAWLSLAPGSTLTTTSQETTRVSLLIAGSQTVDRNGDGIADPPVTIGASGPFYGFLYAPLATVSLPSSFPVYGAVVAQRLKLGTNAKVHLDRALLEGNAEGSLPENVCWRVEELPPSALVRMSYDPLTVLRVNNIVPVRPAQAHLPIGVVLPVPVVNWLLPVTRP